MNLALIYLTIVAAFLSGIFIGRLTKKSKQEIHHYYEEKEAAPIEIKRRKGFRAKRPEDNTKKRKTYSLN